MLFRSNPSLKFVRNNSIRSAIARSLPLIQQADVNFTKHAGCISCHNQGLTSMTVGTTRSFGIPVDETKSAQATSYASDTFNVDRNFWLEGGMGGAGVVGQSYSLLLLHSEGRKPTITTDAMGRSIKLRQMPGGYWQALNTANSRPPLGTTGIGRTALALRSLQLFAQTLLREQYNQAVELAGKFQIGRAHV